MNLFNAYWRLDESHSRTNDTRDASRVASKGNPLNRFSFDSLPNDCCVYRDSRGCACALLATHMNHPRTTQTEASTMTDDDRAKPNQFGRRFGRFGSVWSTSTKSKSQDVKGIKYNLVDLVDIHRRGVSRCAPARPPARARPRSQDPFPPSDDFDQIDQIDQKPDAVQRFSFGRRRPNASKLVGIWSNSRPNRLTSCLVRGRSR